MKWRLQESWIGIGILTSSIAWGQATERVSVASSGAQGNAPSFSVSMSGDGRWVVFSSDASNLVPGDAPGASDVFVRDRQNGTTELANVDSNGVVGDGGGGNGDISSDGRFVAFASGSTNLVPGSTNGFVQVYVHDRWTGATERVSTDSNGVEGDLDCYGVSLSPDGRYVAFVSESSNLVPGDTNGWDDVFVHDRQTGATERISVDSTGVEGDLLSGYSASAFSADGRFVAFLSFAANLVPGDTNADLDVFLRDRQAGTTERVSVGAGGAQGNHGAYFCAMSGDARYVAFGSAATNLVPSDTNDKPDIFVRDRQLGTTVRVSVSSNGVQGNGDSSVPRISPDGRFVAFTSAASNLVPGNQVQYSHAYVHDRMTGTTVQADVDGQGGFPDDWIDWSTLSISADGRQVGFAGGASNLVPGDTNGVGDVFVHDFGPIAGTPFCFGDGSATPCPCGNSGNPSRGCQNSSTTGGAVLGASGRSSLGLDTLRMTSQGERASALSLFIQSDTSIAPVNYGDGLFCLGGSVYRLYTKNASGGVVTAPQGADPSISARSAALNDPIAVGATRYYQVYYRDPANTFCPDPPGNTWNVSNALSVVWGP